jgi:glycosyltransferase involved in cell wall biosynthesis
VVAASPRVHIIVQNLPVPFDRRVWLECQALRSAGFDVSVVCPRGPQDAAEETLDGVAIYRYPAPKTGTGKFDFAREYAYSFAATAWYTARAWRRSRFDVLQACNPPDIFWPLALAFRARGVQFVFDHHDLCPELFEAKFATRRSSLYRGVRALEWCTFRSAHHVIATNDSYRAVAMSRGKKRHTEVTVVRTGPDPVQMRPVEACDDLRRGRRHLVVYLGVMGSQDGVDLALRAANRLVHGMGRSDVSFTFIGSGESYEELRHLCSELGLNDHVEMPGRLPNEDVARLLSTADVGLCPDPKNALNDASTMNKTMEYMAFGLPVVAFDLHETRVSAADAAVYAEANDVEAFAGLVDGLLSDPARRERMGRAGRRRVVDVLSWEHQAPAYVHVMGILAGRQNAVVPTTIAAVA